MDHELLCELYKKMLLIRSIEAAVTNLKEENPAIGAHSALSGQEAVTIGACSVVENEDFVVAPAGSCSHYIAMNGNPGRYLAEVLGKRAGCSRGRSGGLFIHDSRQKVFCGWGSHGAHITIANGIAYAEKLKHKDCSVLCFIPKELGDSGALQEGLALAARENLPVVFIIQNNCAIPGEDLSLKALGFPIARDSIDGHDIFAVRSSVHAAIRKAREQKLPSLIETRTPPAPSDRDPIAELAEKMKAIGIEKTTSRIEEEVAEELKIALLFATESATPDPDSISDFIYPDNGRL